MDLEPGQARVARLNTAWVKIGGFRVFMRFSDAAGPDAPPMVLVHGLSMSSSYLAPLARSLAPFYRVYLPDLPGFGHSQKPGRALTIPEIGDFLADFQNHLSLGPAHFAGNSMGCNFIVDFALRYPERVRNLALIGPTMDERARNLPEAFFNGLRNMLREPPRFLLIMAKDYLAHGFRRTAQTLNYGLDDPIERKLPRVQALSLVLRGEGDTIVSQPWVEQVTRLLPRGQLVVIPGGAHVVHYEKPGPVAAAIIHFNHRAVV